MKVRLSFAWYDLWVGAYWSRDNRTLYICPLPMVLLTIGPLGPEDGACGDLDESIEHCEQVAGSYLRELRYSVRWLDPSEPKPADPKIGDARATPTDLDMFAEVFDGKRWVTWAQWHSVTDPPPAYDPRFAEIIASNPQPAPRL